MATATLERTQKIGDVIQAKYDTPALRWVLDQPLTSAQLEEALLGIGRYNEFKPRKVAAALRKIDPKNKMVWRVGRAYSPVLYGECEDMAFLYYVASKAFELDAAEIDVEYTDVVSQRLAKRDVGAYSGAEDEAKTIAWNGIKLLRLWWD